MTTPTWYSDTNAAPRRPTAIGWALAAVRGVLMVVVLLFGLVCLFALRGIEHLFFKGARKLSPFVTQLVCRICLAIMGLKVVRNGARMQGGGAVVANHSSWLDILVLNAGQRIVFLSKAEVADWPGIGALARATGTLFIARDRNDAARHVRALGERFEADQQVLFFPEGTSTDGRRVLPFKTTLFAAFFAPDLQPLRVQPLTVDYQAPAHRDARMYGWWGDMDLGPHLLDMLSTWRHGTVRLTYHPIVETSDFANRKILARHLENQVRGAHSG